MQPNCLTGAVCSSCMINKGHLSFKIYTAFSFEMVGLCNKNTLEHNDEPKTKHHSVQKLKYNYFRISHVYTNSPTAASSLPSLKKFQ